jgi:hypothetical protein
MRPTDNYRIIDSAKKVMKCATLFSCKIYKRNQDTICHKAGTPQIIEVGRGHMEEEIKDDH